MRDKMLKNSGMVAQINKGLLASSVVKKKSLQKVEIGSKV